MRRALDSGCRCGGVRRGLRVSADAGKNVCVGFQSYCCWKRKAPESLVFCPGGLGREALREAAQYLYGFHLKPAMAMAAQQS